MSKVSAKIKKFENKTVANYSRDRLLGQWIFAQALSQRLDGKFDDLLCSVIDETMSKAQKENGVITEETLQCAEEAMQSMVDAAKEYNLIVPAHAHIDMNWLWRFDETVAITLSTFSTMLRLMEEYPEFKFSQSQASVYKIVEEYGEPEMLEQIKRRVHEGRWEVAAATWVEADRNMPSAESLARHLLYTKKYLSKLLDLPEDYNEVDFEPDTFGHHANVPEYLNKAGIRYYYHHRGSMHPPFVRWVSPSGAWILSYNDICRTAYNFYNVNHTLAENVIRECPGNIRTAIRIIGVGDHGGGPTRRDIERVIDMMKWPVYPRIRFGTYKEFFDIIAEKHLEEIPVHNGAMNYIFTGCYTSESRIKLSNRIGEAAMEEAELFASAANVISGRPYRTEHFEEAWRRILFNQFHDILPGSGLIDTREYAMGEFQKVLACAGAEKNGALRSIIGKLDTSAFIADDCEKTQSEGAGVGFGVNEFIVGLDNTGYGEHRVFHFFNPSPVKRTVMTQVTVWDWENSELGLMEFTDINGNVIPHTLLSYQTAYYWGHHYINVILPVTLEGYGYTTYLLAPSENNVIDINPMSIEEGRVDRPFSFVLENELVRIVLDTKDASITSYFDKTTGREYINGGKKAGFRLIEEGTEHGMTAWRDGRHMNVRHFDTVHIHKLKFFGTEQQRTGVQIDFAWSRSKLTATFTLDKDSKVLRINAECDWHEVGVEGRIPQFNYVLPLAFEPQKSLRDIPGGTEYEQCLDQDLPATVFMLACDDFGGGLMLSTDTKYAYRCFDSELSVDLIRSSFNPDPYPEYGKHNFNIAVCPVAQIEEAAIAQLAKDLWHPFTAISAMPHKGELACTGKLFDIDGAHVSAVKMAQSGEKALIIRLMGYAKETQTAHVKVNGARKASVCDLCENVIEELQVNDSTCAVEIKNGQVITVKIEL